MKALPKLAKGAKSPKLKQLFTAHLQETKNQAERLRKPTGFVTVRLAIATKDSPRLYVR